jgi:dynein heavy chain
MVQAKETRKIINDTLDSYKPVAKRGRDIYFVIADLALIDPMYQYSLEYFVALFKLRLDKTEKSEDVKVRCDILKKDITISMYENICRGLFEKHKLLFAFMISCKIDRNEGRISKFEWNYFCRGSPNLSEEELQGKPDFITTTNQWTQLIGLQNVGRCFTGFKSTFLKERGGEKNDFYAGDIWLNIIDSTTPWECPLPALFTNKLSPF